MSGLCSSCEKRQTCVELCEEANNYSNQDYAPQTELTVGTSPECRDPNYQDYDGWPDVLHDNIDRTNFRELFSMLSKREKQIVAYIMAFQTKEEICKLLDITKENYKERLIKIKRKAKNSCFST